MEEEEGITDKTNSLTMHDPQHQQQRSGCPHVSDFSQHSRQKAQLQIRHKKRIT